MLLTDAKDLSKLEVEANFNIQPGKECYSFAEIPGVKAKRPILVEKVGKASEQSELKGSWLKTWFQAASLPGHFLLSSTHALIHVKYYWAPESCKLSS